jgi:type I restriction enzyme M protein
MSNLSSVIKSIQDVMRQGSGVDGDARRISRLTWLLFLKVFDALEEEMELTRDASQSPIPEPLRWRNWAADAEGIVTRVAQLRRLCTDLRQRLSASQSTQAHLAEALVQQAS